VGSRDWYIHLVRHNAGSNNGVVKQFWNTTFRVTFSAGTKDVFVTYPSSKSVNLDASGNATALGTPAAFVGTNITGTASGLTAGNVTTNANLGNSFQMPAASGTAGEIRATNNVTAYYSDDRFKTNLGNIPEALAKVLSLNGFLRSQ
jgi:hypothetical protein